MPSSEFLDSIGKSSRPETNVSGDFDCFKCRESVSEAYYDYENQVLKWWCLNDHESFIKDFKL